MPEQTNLLRARAKAYAAPLLAFALVLSTGALIVGHRHVNAATAADNTITPINNASIDPLLALDQATEAVASRVTPAVVNIAVTSHAPEQPAEAQGDDQGQEDNPFAQFFGPGFGHAWPRPWPDARSTANRARYRQWCDHLPGRIHRDQQSRSGWGDASAGYAA